jgi:predicted nucleotidyltransferase
MKKSLAHLPQHKLNELQLIKDIILEKIPDVRMIVLFGSYARGQAVEDIHPEGRYKKEYKITHEAKRRARKGKKQLEYLAKRVKLLQRLTKKICKAKIESFV